VKNHLELEKSDVVAMYKATDLQTYSDYGTTVLAWGGAHTIEDVRVLTEMGIHATGSMWCLTAGAEALHKNADLREATCRDIENKPIAVPWLHDHVYEGTPSLWGCTNHPTFRAHMRAKVCEAMAGGAYGLHVDDHLGTASPAAWQGGCFCDYCVEGFRRHLQRAGNPEHLRQAGVASWDGYDYRDTVRKYAKTREEYLRVQQSIPLHQEFVDYQVQQAAENVRQLKRLAEDIVGREVSLSANAGLPSLMHTVVTPYLSYLVAEVEHHASQGTSQLLEAVRAYRMAEAIGKEVAATAAGWDNAYIYEHGSEQLMCTWIALAYACGQRFMMPSRMWCYTKEKGTHWYQGRTEVFAPLYRFVREHRRLFDGLATVGPLKAPAGAPETFETHEKRLRLQSLLAEGDPRPMSVGESVWLFPREGNGVAVIHAVNMDYVQQTDTVVPKKDLTITVPDSLFGRRFGHATLYTYEQCDGRPEELRVSESEGGISVVVPSLRLWGVIELAQ
jgi:hypothetical protein